MDHNLSGAVQWNVGIRNIWIGKDLHAPDEAEEIGLGWKPFWIRWIADAHVTLDSTLQTVAYG